MPVDTDAGDGRLRQWNAGEIEDMEIETFDVRTGGHPTESRRVNENVMTRTFLVKWSERFNFVSLVLGDVALYSDAGTAKLSRQLPDSTFGRHPDSTLIMATRVDEIKGHGCGVDNAGQFPEYDKAAVRVFYEQARFDIRSDSGLTSERHRFTTRSPSGQVDVEQFTLPGAAFKYTKSGGGDPHGLPVPFNIGFTRPVQRFTTTWHDLPNDLYKSGGALFNRLFVGVSGDGIPWLGCVNSADLVLPSMGTYPAGTLLLEGLEEEQTVSPLTATGLASLRWDIGFKWAYTPRGWLDLFYFDPATPGNSGYYRCSVDGTYYAVADMPDKKGLYNVRDMTDLWNPHLA